MFIWRMIPIFGNARSGEERAVVRLRSVAGEFFLVAFLFLAYKGIRLLVAGHADQAMANATTVWHLERWLHLPSELAAQHAVAGQHWLVLTANCYYAYVHFPATVACLIWLYLRRPTLYRQTRRTLAGLTAAALAFHIWFPLAPPRLVSSTGLVDTGTLFGPAVYGPPDTDTLSNQYAAMPSLHVGWALAVALALIAATRGRLRWLWLAHPVITLAVVVTTGNHYWLDAIVAVALLFAVSAVVVRAPQVRLAPSAQRYGLRALAPAVAVATLVVSSRGHAPDPADVIPDPTAANASWISTPGGGEARTSPGGKHGVPTGWVAAPGPAARALRRRETGRTRARCRRRRGHPTPGAVDEPANGA
jgi:hypothetical protein